MRRSSATQSSISCTLSLLDSRHIFFLQSFFPFLSSCYLDYSLSVSTPRKRWGPGGWSIFYDSSRDSKDLFWLPLWCISRICQQTLVRDNLTSHLLHTQKQSTLHELYIRCIITSTALTLLSFQWLLRQELVSHEPHETCGPILAHKTMNKIT